MGAKATGTGWNSNWNNWDAINNEYKDSGITRVSVSSKGGNGSTDLVHTLTYTDYIPIMTSKSGENVSFLTINGTVTGETWKKNLSAGTSGNNKPPAEYMCYDGNKITVSAADSECNGKGLYSAEIVFYWLNNEKEPRYDDEEGYKGIKIAYPNGSSEKVLGNITPLPFLDKNGFLNDSEEWQ